MCVANTHGGVDAWSQAVHETLAHLRAVGIVSYMKFKIQIKLIFLMSKMSYYKLQAFVPSIYSILHHWLLNQP